MPSRCMLYIFLTIAVSNDCTFITVPTETVVIFMTVISKRLLWDAIIDCFKIESIHQLYKEYNNIILLFNHSLILLRIRATYFDTFLK